MTFQIEKINGRDFKNFLKSSKKNKNSLWIVKPG